VRFSKGCLIRIEGSSSLSASSSASSATSFLQTPAATKAVVETDSNIVGISVGVVIGGLVLIGLIILLILLIARTGRRPLTVIDDPEITLKNTPSGLGPSVSSYTDIPFMRQNGSKESFYANNVQQPQLNEPFYANLQPSNKQPNGSKESFYANAQPSTHESFYANSPQTNTQI